MPEVALRESRPRDNPTIIKENESLMRRGLEFSHLRCSLRAAASDRKGTWRTEPCLDRAGDRDERTMRSAWQLGSVIAFELWAAAGTAGSAGLSRQAAL